MSKVKKVAVNNSIVLAGDTTKHKVTHVDEHKGSPIACYVDVYGNGRFAYFTQIAKVFKQ